MAKIVRLKKGSRNIRLVVAAVIERDREFLVCKRPAGKRHGGLWEFPGGKLLPGESIDGAVRRELREELDVEVTGTGKVLFCGRDPGSSFLIEFLEVGIDKEPTALEHDEIQWAARSTLSTLTLAPVDRQFVNFLTSE